MQNEQDYSQQAHYLASAQQQGMGGSFVTAHGDLFSYPLSAPAGGPGYGAHRSFWDPDPSLAGMDIDFATNGGGVYHPPTPHQVPTPVDWASTNQMLQNQGGMVGHGNVHASVGGAQSSLVSPSPVAMAVTSSADHAMFAASYPTPIEDPFGMNDSGGAVNPGLIFSRPPSANMEDSYTHSMSGQSLASVAPSQDSQAGSRRSSIQKAPLRRSASAKDATPRKPERALASSPVKEVGRPAALSRSVSESRGKKTLGRPSLPPLAPRPRSQLASTAGVNANKPVISQPQRPSGRSSPVKTHHHHHRLSSLSSIPETAGPQMRTQAKFMIDSNGRARVETSVVVVDDAPPTTTASARKKRHSLYPPPRRQWDSSEEEDSSSTDDEPIIIPSRNTSFALPDPRKPTSSHPFHHHSQRSFSERSTTSYASFQGGGSQPPDPGDSDGETVVNHGGGGGGSSSDLTPTGKASGDALRDEAEADVELEAQAGCLDDPPLYARGSAPPPRDVAHDTERGEFADPDDGGGQDEGDSRYWARVWGCGIACCGGVAVGA
ncbi:hypothetical protein N0V88_002051 [Collariella sp. IMI 366227]|nr:hypothetical protein N0V88_002051 [Collariella sp. IMI 366227]